MIKIKGENYKTYFTKELINDGAAIGRTDLTNRKITIYTGSPPELLKQTMIHEVIHAYFNECGLERYCNDEILVEWLERHFDNILLTSMQLNEVYKKTLLHKKKKKSI